MPKSLFIGDFERCSAQLLVLSHKVSSKVSFFSTQPLSWCLVHDLSLLEEFSWLLSFVLQIFFSKKVFS